MGANIKNLFTFILKSLQYCSQNYCTLVPKITAVHFPEITALLIPVYKWISHL
jgi:hypothetical protein